MEAAPRTSMLSPMRDHVVDFHSYTNPSLAQFDLSNTTTRLPSPEMTAVSSFTAYETGTVNVFPPSEDRHPLYFPDASIVCPSLYQEGEDHRNTLTNPICVALTLSSVSRGSEPTASRVPSDDSDTERPNCSHEPSPTRSPPTCVQSSPTNANTRTMPV